jgi:hypothetical protein
MVPLAGSSSVGENSKVASRPVVCARNGRLPGAPQNILARTGRPSTTSRGAPEEASTGFLDLRTGRPGLDLSGSVVDGHVGAGPAERNGDCSADPSAGAGDERDFAGQVVGPLGPLRVKLLFQASRLAQGSLFPTSLREQGSAQRR